MFIPAVSVLLERFYEGIIWKVYPSYSFTTFSTYEKKNPSQIMHAKKTVLVPLK